MLLLYKPLQRWLIRRADTIIGTTPVYLKESPYLQDAQDKTVAVPIGIKPVTFDEELVRQWKQRYAGKKLVVSIGRLVPYKGYTYLIQACQHLGDDYQVLVVGDGPLMDNLLGEVQEYGVQDRIHFLGYVEDDEMHALLAACDLFVMSSVMKTEAFGIVQLEAMSCHKPIVATRIPGSGVAWVNEDGVSGRNVTPGKPEEYAAAIQEVTANSEKFGESAYLRYLKCFTRQQMLTQIQKLYEDV
jgi:rhamnosyl/mannosyltransferase